MAVRAGQARLRKIARELSQGNKLTDADQSFIVTALLDIANGMDPGIALNVLAKRGERKSKFARDAKIRRQFANGWIAAAIAPVSEDGLGLTLKDAVALLKSGVPRLPSEQSLRRYWNDVRKDQQRVFKIKPD